MPSTAAVFGRHDGVTPTHLQLLRFPVLSSFQSIAKPLKLEEICHSGFVNWCGDESSHLRVRQFQMPYRQIDHATGKRPHETMAYFLPGSQGVADAHSSSSQTSTSTSSKRFLGISRAAWQVRSHPRNPHLPISPSARCLASVTVQQCERLENEAR
jgi:hypothetical protein